MGRARLPAVATAIPRPVGDLSLAELDHLIKCGPSESVPRCAYTAEELARWEAARAAAEASRDALTAAQRARDIEALARAVQRLWRGQHARRGVLSELSKMLDTALAAAEAHLAELAAALAEVSAKRDALPLLPPRSHARITLYAALFI